MSTHQKKRYYKRVYLASPYTLGDVAVNVRKQMEMANLLIDLGYLPFVPLLYHFQHMFFPRAYEEWLAIDKEWVTVCDCVLRLEGESKGADGEVALANDKKIPVFYSINDLVDNDNLITAH
jgi:hypothetical protein